MFILLMNNSKNVILMLFFGYIAFFNKKNLWNYYSFSATDYEIALFPWTDSKLKLENALRTQKLSFKVEGMVTHENLLLVFGSHSCSVINSEKLGIDAEISVTGFEGTLERAMWIDLVIFGLVTDKGFHIFDTSENYNAPYFSIMWTEDFGFKSVCVSPNTRIVFVLNKKGQLAKSPITNTRIEPDEMDQMQFICFQ